MDGLVGLAGETVAAGDLAIPRAAAFAEYAGGADCIAFDLVDCRRWPGGEGVVVRARAEVPQRPRNDIRSEEPLLVAFVGDERRLPEVLALRRDFPDVPHLNLTRREVPKSLCLFAERPEDLLLRWTPALLAERILWWLRETARGTLHHQDQALEPFIGGSFRPLVVPPDLFDQGHEEVLGVYSADAGLGREVLIADRPERLPPALSGETITLLAYALPVQEHGVIRREPQTLRDLHALCLGVGFDLLQALRQTLKSRIGEVRPESTGTVLLLAVPKARDVSGEFEVTDYYGFWCGVRGEGDALTDVRPVGPGPLGVALGVLGLMGTRYLPVLSGGAASDLAAAEGVHIQMLIPRVALTPGAAAILSGHGSCDDRKILAVGQGALGSQVFANLIKQGYGRWTLVDEDYLLPHNLTRHAVMGRRVGMPKAPEMAQRANDMFASPPVARGIVADVLAPRDAAEELAQSYRDAAVILDMSASVAVSRHLALDVASPAKRIAVFLSPSGRDLTVMSEGDDRLAPLDVIEAQYLRAVLNDGRLDGHLADGGSPVRYGGTCRDLSARISPEAVALHAGLGAAAVRSAAATHEPTLSVWRYDPDQIGVDRVTLPVRGPVILQAASWTVVTDEGLRDKLMQLRSAKLPKETCGIVIGYFDTYHKRVYLVDALPAPIDSVEEEDGCMRGVGGLQEAVAAASGKTLGQVEYVGEWHSHPDKASCRPSQRDHLQMKWVRSRMHPEEKPALILIACENQTLTVFLEAP